MHETAEWALLVPSRRRARDGMICRQQVPHPWPRPGAQRCRSARLCCSLRGDADRDADADGRLATVDQTPRLPPWFRARDLYISRSRPRPGLGTRATIVQRVHGWRGKISALPDSHGLVAPAAPPTHPSPSILDEQVRTEPADVPAPALGKTRTRRGGSAVVSRRNRHGVDGAAPAGRRSRLDRQACCRPSVAAKYSARPRFGFCRRARG